MKEESHLKNEGIIEVPTEYQGLKKRIIRTILIECMNSDIALLAKQISKDANSAPLPEDAYRLLRDSNYISEETRKEEKPPVESSLRKRSPSPCNI